MMKIDILARLMERIQKEIQCPRCRVSFERENIEITRIDGNHIDLTSTCKHCGSHAQIAADIGISVQSKDPITARPETLSGKSLVKKLVNLKTFKSDLGRLTTKDIEKLLP